MLRLTHIEKPLANFFASGILNLKDKLGPFLWQFPEMFHFKPERLEAFFKLLPRDTKQALSLARRRDARMTGRSRLATDANRPLRHALEIRHQSFDSDDFISLLKKHGIGLVVADTAGRWPKMFELTADFVYVRLHGDRVIYTSGYTRRALRSPGALGPRARASGEDERWKFNRRARPGGNRPPSRTRTGGIPARR